MKYILLFLLVFNLLSLQTSFAAKPKKPNILLILVDDMGWSDVGCFGSEIKTPNIDALAATGIRFRQFYNTSKCFTSRACLLSGVYHQECGFKKTHSNHLHHVVTLAEVLKSAGYQTYASGKNHALDNLFNRGFDHYYGLRDGAANHFNPGLKRKGEPKPAQKRARHWADDKKVFNTRDPSKQNYFPPTFYTTDAYTAKAKEYLAEWKKQHTGKPFFLYLAYTAPHDPMMAHPEDIKKHKNIYSVGYEKIRNARYQKQLKMGLINKKQYALSPPVYRSWNSLTSSQKKEQTRRMQVYAAMIDRLDQKIGEVVTQLKKMGVYDNTLIIFCSDNGASAENVKNVGNKNLKIGGVGRWASLQRDWANVCNTPFQFFKNNSDEGGIRTPTIAHWPKGIVHPGRFADHPWHLIDFMPTFVELSGATYPKTDPKQGDILPMRGISFANVLFDKPVGSRPPLFFQWKQGKAIIDGKYKLIKHDNKSPWKLYDLTTDATELHNLKNKMPEIYKTLLKKYTTWFENLNKN